MTLIQRMWENGPLRMFSDKPEKGCKMPYESKVLSGYAGAYVCELCRKTCDGVYQVAGKWLGGCWVLFTGPR